MSGAALSLSRRITTAGDLEGVVRAMKALAVSSIGQYERSVRALDDYARTLELGLGACLRERGPQPKGAPSHHGPPPRVGAVVFGSDQGLVGRFNEVVADYAEHWLEGLKGTTCKLWAVGERVRALLPEAAQAGNPPMALPTSVGSITSMVGEILIAVEHALEKREVSDVYVFHNAPRAASSYAPVGKLLLPFDRAWQARISAEPWPTKVLVQVIEGPTPALPAFLREFLFVSLFQACAESLASENASRLASMQRAEKNIDDMLVDLNRTYHRMRQEAIDEELFDVISGYEALTAAKPGA